ncbi:hypothetical protein BDU57DRAFT_596192 [Ampelomyces quisqualis]|uniref:Nephrocystin 3-like N-terminal domain-containing protein n=1 Tax=Ampelomyces quisqualis TaxID=50730 RepID=A0A6A5QH16_AMPQU|nr:hypothetical protein BDU57DRAFT_596192 [Ampelomyces quisqualis]
MYLPMRSSRTLGAEQLVHQRLDPSGTSGSLLRRVLFQIRSTAGKRGVSPVPYTRYHRHSVEALSGGDLAGFDVTERFSWAANRQTTKEEDGAYCLFGIFSIHLLLIFDEDKESARKRLRSAAGHSHDHKKVRKICSWLSAPDPSTNNYKAHKHRQAETVLCLLDGLNFAKWKLCAASRLWLYGILGCGKTILSSTVIEHLLQHCYGYASMVTAYFDFNFNDAQKKDLELMLRSLRVEITATQSKKLHTKATS